MTWRCGERPRDLGVVGYHVVWVWCVTTWVGEEQLMKRRQSEAATSSTTKRRATSGLGRLKGEEFGQRIPPIYEILKNILQEYPSGQIFKVSHYNYTSTW